MGKLSRAVVAAVVIVFLAMGTSWADMLSGFMNITAYDGYSSGTGWYGSQEDQETEPGTVATQAWDLEGIFYNTVNGDVAIVRGWNFKDGVSPYVSGDVFIFNSPYSQYGYGVHMDFANSEYSIYDLYGATLINATTISQSNPYAFTGGVYGETDTLKFYSGLTDADVGGLQGGSHYMIVLNELMLYNGETIHFTMECGNDMINSAPVPVPPAIWLLGSGLVGLLTVRRKFTK